VNGHQVNVDQLFCSISQCPGLAKCLLNYDLLSKSLMSAWPTFIARPKAVALFLLLA